MVDPNTLPRGSGQTILVVEDDQLVLNSLGQMLEILEYNAILEQSPLAAVATATGRDDIACVISDIVMPEMSGLELWRKLLAAGRRVPTLFMSGYIKSDYPLREHDVRVVKKPLEIDVLAERLATLLKDSSD